jgi:hypothetical protein
LNLAGCQNLQSLGELISVGGWLGLNFTPIEEKMTKAEVRTKIDIGGSLFMV